MESAEKRELQVGEMETKRLEIERAYNELKAEFEILIQDHKYDREEDIQHIKGQYALADTNTSGDALDPLVLEQTMQERDKILQDKEIKEKEITSKEKIAKNKDATTRYVADNALKVAKENQTKAELKSKKKP